MVVIFGCYCIRFKSDVFFLHILGEFLTTTVTRVAEIPHAVWKNPWIARKCTSANARCFWLWSDGLTVYQQRDCKTTDNSKEGFRGTLGTTQNPPLINNGERLIVLVVNLSVCHAIMCMCGPGQAQIYYI